MSDPMVIICPKCGKKENIIYVDKSKRSYTLCYLAEGGCGALSYVHGKRYK